MATTHGLLKVLEKCRTSPPHNTVAEQSIPLTFFDMAWILFHPVHQLFFYDYPHSKADFIEKVIPNLKHSLSVTLQHFFPFASNLIAFPEENHLGKSRKPEFRYAEGDSLALTFAECDLDFNDLKGNHPRDCNKFYSLVPLLESGIKVDDYVKFPVFAIQVTIFPNSGITIGLTNHHALCDARSRYDFLMAWTSIAKHGTDEMFLASANSLPFYDRVIEYPNSLDEMLLSLPPIKNLDEKYKPPELVHQTDKVRAIFILTRTQINLLKKWLLVQLPELQYVSSFTVGCAYVWSCIAKSRVHVEGKKGEYEVERFACVADLRGRLDPPVPQTYFGNCVGLLAAPTKTTLLTAGNKGFAHAVEVLGNGIKETLKFKQGIFKDAETWLEMAFLPVPTIGVAGTPKLNVYDVDFGWGKPQKYETISLDFNDSISVNAGKDSPGDLEIGLCLPSKQMDAFLTISKNQLESILSEQE
ncbi:malonyl-coenzyme A:anthocyanin 3-O-glucoside-6''-O-malonyltransferase-like protein [Tanacetum coccineum]|uniref:Malonyl-coenzyme A:anthocyanin 3-O-glucoside-6''-O-malonyltransferase-like protein n=1 Tax=Tanacetum coccineum TaxID=301880 RepID=A0ABQ4YTM5_9ASTR